MLEIRNLSHSYETAGGPREVLREVTLSLSDGETLAVLAPSGSGKTVLLSILGALLRPAAGQVLLDGLDPYVLDDAHLALFRNDRVGFVFPYDCLLPHLSVIENLMLPLMIGAEDTMGPERARRLLKEVGLGEQEHGRPASLSRLDRQRVAVVRALVRQPKLLICDEPTAELPGDEAVQLVKTIRALGCAHPVTTVVATNDEAVARGFARWARLEGGRLSLVEGGAG